MDRSGKDFCQPQNQLVPNIDIKKYLNTPTGDSIPFAFLVKEVAILFPEDILSGTMKYEKTERSG